MNITLRATKSLMSFSRYAFSTKSTATVGFVGLGHMGSKMVANLAQDGHSIIVYDRSEDAIKAVTAAHPTKVAQGSLADIATKCSVILTMLPNDDIVETYYVFLAHFLSTRSNHSKINCLIYCN